MGRCRFILGELSSFFLPVHSYRVVLFVLGMSVNVICRRMAKEDAETVTIPHAILASKDEPVDEVEAYDEAIKRKRLGGFVETYGDMWHGWMGARADLQKEASLKEYTRG